MGELTECGDLLKSLKVKERGGGLKKSLAISEVVRGEGGPLGIEAGCGEQGKVRGKERKQGRHPC